MNSTIDMISAVDLMNRAGVAATPSRLSGHLKQSYGKSVKQLQELHERGIVICHVTSYRRNVESRNYRLSTSGENVLSALVGCEQTELPF